MRLIIIIFLVAFCFNSNLYSQFNNKSLLLKHNPWRNQDTSSVDLLSRYKNIPDLRVQIRDSYEHENLKIFKVAPSVKHISIYSNSIKSLAGLEYLQSLETLAIKTDSIKDYSSLNNLKKIKRLTLNSKVKIDFPLEYDSLKILNYSCNYEIGQCRFPQLEYLNIHQAVAYDTHYDDENYGEEYRLEKPCYPIVLSPFNALQEINMYDMHIRDISEITFPKNLKKLRIVNCKNLSNIDGIKELASLENLAIAFCNNIQNFEFLKDIKNLKWEIMYMGRIYTNANLEDLLSHPSDVYFFADEKEIKLENGSFYNFHPSVIEKSKVIFKKYHRIILNQNLSRKEFLDLIPPLIGELNKLCTTETCNIDWADEESDYLMYFLIEMSQMAEHEFDESHFYKMYEEM